MAVQCGLRKLSPKTIGETYLPGVAHGLDKHCRGSGAAELVRRAIASREIKTLLKGFERFYSKNNPKSDRVKLPFCMDLALKAKAILLQTQFKRIQQGSRSHIILQRRIFVSMVMGITFLLRKSEHIGSMDKLPISRRAVTFFDKYNRAIPYKEVGLNTKAQSVLANIQYSKTDLFGMGRRARHTRQQGDPDACVVQVLENWVRLTRDEFGAKEEDSLYHIPGLENYDVNVLHQVMAATAIQEGAEDGHKKPTSHSLRYGGATMMAAAGFPQYIIAIYGGWTENSTSLRVYTKPSEEMLQMVSLHMSQMALLNTSQHFIMDATARAKMHT